MADVKDTAAEDEAILVPLRERFPNVELQLIRPDKRVSPLVFRRATGPEYSAYRRALGDDSTKSTATHNLFMTLCVYPASPMAVLDVLPGLLDSKMVQKTLGYVTGVTADAEGKG